MKGYKAFKKGLICDPTGKIRFSMQKTLYADGEKIKEDTFYKLKNGEFFVCD